MTPPQIADNPGWPFKMLSRVPYRPDNQNDWRDGILRGLCAGGRAPFHAEGISR